jgi:MYXO-CTERM domain-containing protein
MRRFALAPLALLVALAAPTTSAATTATAPAARPAVLTGSLSTPSTRAAIDVARDVLATHAPWSSALSLSHVGTAQLGGGEKVVAFTQSMAGVPVFQRGAKVVVEKDGRATQLSMRLEEKSPRTLVPTLTPAQAVAKAGVPANKLGARLMVLPTGGEPLLVYGVVGDLGAIPSRPVVLVDAHTGEVVLAWEAAVSLKKAKVYKDNPIKTPTLEEVTLTSDETKEGLQNGLVIGKNCIDKHTTRDLDFGTPVTIHSCELLPTITPDASGDYVSIAPEGDTAPEDKYAELSMFYNTMRAYDHVHDIGFPADKDTPINAIANLRMPAGFSTFDTKKMADPTIPLVAFDNAFFAEEDPLLSTAFDLSGDAMWFGQGTLIDFGYDGDVVYHEFGHFVVSRTIKLAGGFWQDQFGLSSSPGALNEGLADVNSFFVSDDPELGEYSSKGLGGTTGKGLRSGLNKFTFPDSITGEVHQDSEPYTAAMWEAYGALDADKRLLFQKAHMKMLLTAPTGNLGFADLAELDIKAITEGVSADVGNALRAAFEKRGIKKDEPRVRKYAGTKISSVVPQLGIHAPGTREMTSKGTIAPGLFQIGYDAPAGGTTKFTVTFKVLPAQSGGAFGGMSGTKFAPSILLKTSADPITFKYGPTTSDATATFPCTIASNVATCTGETDIAGDAGKTAPVHLMVVNGGQQGGDYDNVEVTAEGPPAPTPDPDAGTTPASDAQPDDTVKSGCGCDVPGSSSRTSAGLALTALALALVSRRKRS